MPTVSTATATATTKAVINARVARLPAAERITAGEGGCVTFVGAEVAKAAVPFAAGACFMVIEDGFADPHRVTGEGT